MHRMVVVVEVEPAPEPAGFVDDHAVRRERRRAVFMEGTQHRQAECRIADGQHIAPGADAGEQIDGPQQAGQQREVLQPGAGLAEVAAPGLADDVEPRRHDHHRGSDRDPAERRALGDPEGAAPGVQRAVIGCGDVVAFRIEPGFGERVVAVVREVAAAVKVVRAPDRERGQAQQAVQPGAAGRVPVQQLVLDAHEPAGREDQQRGAQPGPEPGHLPGRAQPGRVSRDDHQPGRPFGAGGCNTDGAWRRNRRADHATASWSGAWTVATMKSENAITKRCHRGTSEVACNVRITTQEPLQRSASWCSRSCLRSCTSLRGANPASPAALHPSPSGRG